MRTSKILISGIVALFILSAIVVLDDPEAKDELPEWTFMVYLDADNNLEEAGIDDLNEMEEVGSSDDVNIVVQMDRIDGYDPTNGDWTDCRRFYIEKDLDTDRITSPEIEQLGEINMGDPEVLIDFVKWSKENYPAKKYALVLWDHGGAFRGICFDDTVPGLPEGEYDMINMTEMNHAAREIYRALGNQRVDLWGFDACLMAQMAVMYELKDFVTVGVGSGYNEPGDGWPYDEILRPFVDKPEMDERELGKIIVHEYIYSYNNHQQDPDDYPMVTQAAFDLTRMDVVTGVIDEFAEELASRGPLGSMEYLLQIYQARKNCNSYDMANVFTYDLTNYPMYDVIDFTILLEDYILSAFPKNDLILDLCVAVRNAVFDPNDIEGSFMFASEADQWHPDANGLSMYFPNKDSDSVSLTQFPTNYLLSYEETSYAKEHIWDEFLHAYYGMDPIVDSYPSIDISDPPFNSTYPREENIIIMRGTAYDREMIDRVEISIDGGEHQIMPGISGQGRIPWLHQLDIRDLEPGTHAIEVRAFDRPTSGSGGNDEKMTYPIFTEITILPGPDDAEDEFKIPSGVISAFLIGIIIATLALGVIIFRGRTG